MLNIDKGWANQNEGSRYPFTDDATLAATDGTTLHIGAVIDAAVGAPSAESAVYLASVDVGADTIALAFAQDGVVVSSVVLTTTSSGWVDLSPVGNAVYAGRIEINPDGIGSVFAMGLGVHTFDAAAATLVPYAVFAAPTTGLQSVAVGDQTLEGDITIIIGDGLEARLLEDGSVQVSAVGLPYLGRDPAELIPRGITTIEVSTENINVAGGSTVEVTPARGAIGADVSTPALTKAAAVNISASGNTVTIGVA